MRLITFLFMTSKGNDCNIIPCVAGTYYLTINFLPFRMYKPLVWGLPFSF